MTDVLDPTTAWGLTFNDRLLSLRRHLYRLYPTNTIEITTGRVADLARPLWRIEHIHHTQFNRTRSMYEDDDTWKLWYYGKDLTDVLDTLSLFEHSLTEGTIAQNNLRKINLIVGWKFNWLFSQPVVTAQNTPDGSIGAGIHTVQVSGLDLEGNETAASLPLAITVTGGTNSLFVRPYRIPYSMPLFTAVKIYVDGIYQTIVQQPDNGYASTTLLGLVTSGAAPLGQSLQQAIRWKNLRVSNVGMRTQEDEITDGQWTGIVNLSTTVQQERVVRLQAQTIQQVQINGADTLYIVTPTSHT